LTRGQPPGLTSPAFLLAGDDGGHVLSRDAVEVKMKAAGSFTCGFAG
jgi:hypothetical protein